MPPSREEPLAELPLCVLAWPRNRLLRDLSFLSLSFLDAALLADWARLRRAGGALACGLARSSGPAASAAFFSFAALT